ncbi:MAG: hypothetical protein V1778_03540 [bacterium]
MPVLLLVWLLNQYFLPFGHLTVRYHPGSASPYFSNVASKEPYPLLGQLADGQTRTQFQYLTVDPVYFSVTLPRPFSRADVSIRYLNPDNQPVMKIGSLQADGPYLKNVAMNESFLENLPEYWVRKMDSNLTVWQKDDHLKELYDAFYEKEHTRLQQEHDARMKEIQKQEKKKSISSQEANTRRKRSNQEFQDSIKNIRLPQEYLSNVSVPFASVGDFLKSLPDPKTVLQYEYDLGKLYRLPEYQASSETTTLEYPLRGSHEIVTYIGENEPMSFTFTIQDINRHAGKDAVSIEVWDTTKQIFAEHIDGYGEEKATGRPSEEREINVRKSELPEGAYYLKIHTEDDVFIKKIVTQQHLIVFYKSLYLTDNPEYKEILGLQKNQPTSFFVDGSYLRARTAHENGLQTVEVGKTTMTLDDVQEEKVIDGLSGITTVVSPKNDVQLTTDGYFAFSKDQLFTPTPKIETITPTTPLDRYHYIIADYPQAAQDGVWLKATTSFQNSKLPFDENNTVQFLVNLPRLSENHRRILLQEIQIDFYKKPTTVGSIYDKLKQKLLSSFRRSTQ